MATSAIDALMSAAKGGRADDLEEILNFPTIDVNAADPLGNTPLHYASGSNKEAAVKVILGVKGVNVNAVNAHGDTPLHKASSRAGIEVVRALMEAGADTLLKNEDGDRPADLARSEEVGALVAPVTQDYNSDEEEDLDALMRAEAGEDDDSGSDSD
eukprot:TRINITY_DN1186_c0_g2_i1.p1 TRINITY_DN1186_c0_g2~~TRINITY_DN1186_c0_g2_i1.p1  ORF type:complete len:157 (-),score=41.73 TRINITY_DN1186_c0_g2_i1:107-577(-)